jgi:hypothetical protein
MAPPGSDEDLDGEVSDFCKAACHWVKRASGIGKKHLMKFRDRRASDISDSNYVRESQRAYHNSCNEKIIIFFKKQIIETCDYILWMGVRGVGAGRTGGGVEWPIVDHFGRSFSILLHFE